MANSKVQYTATGATQTFAVPFTFLSRTHVAVTVDGVSDSATWNNDSEIVVATVLSGGEVVLIKRSTSPTVRVVDFIDGSNLTELDLDQSSKQAFYLAQEALDELTLFGDALLATSGHILVGDGTEFVNKAVSGDATITSGGVVAIASDVIVNDDINSAAAIAYSKLDLSGSVVNADVAVGIDAVKLADGTVTNTELQYINSLTSNAQTQIDGLVSGAVTDVLDNTFAIKDDGDGTKKIAFQASGITTGTTRTITMPDADVTLPSSFVTPSSTDTFTNKTIDQASNTLTGVATLTGTQTLTNKTLTSPVLNTGVSGTAILDEDSMASNSATQLATQQSIKAYVDSSGTGLGTANTNIALLGFLISTYHATSALNMQNGFIDQFEDQTGVDDDNSTGETYDSALDAYLSNVTTENFSDTLTEDTTGWQDSTGRQIVDAAGTSGGQVRITVKAASAATSNIDNIAIGVRDGTTADCTATPVEFLFSGTPGVDIQNGETAVSDWLTFTYNASLSHLIVFDIASGTQSLLRELASRDGFYHKFSANSYNSATLAGATLGAAAGYVVTKIEVRNADDMTLIAEPKTALTAPDSAHVALFNEEVDTLTINTDILTWVSRSKQTFTTDFATDNKLNATGHNLVDTDRVMLISSAADLPLGFDSETVYFVVNKTANDLEVSLTSGGAAVAITDNGTGTHSVLAVSQCTLVDQGDFNTGKATLSGTVDISGQPSDTDMTLIVQTKNFKETKLHGQALQYA